MRVSAVWRVVSLVLVAACGLGCAKGPTEDLVLVSGTITLDEKPLEGATVAFIPEKSKQTQPSWGFSDAAGKYHLKTAEGYDGISHGEYRIVVSKLTMQDGSPIPKGSQTGGADGLEIVPFPHCDPRQTKNVAVIEHDGAVFDVAMKSGESTGPRKKR